VRILFLIALLCYLISCGLALFRTTSKVDSPLYRVLLYRIVVTICIIIHVGLLIAEYCGSYLHPANFSLGFIISIAAWMTVVLYFVSSFFGQTLNLGIFILPIGLIGILLSYFNLGQFYQLESIPQQLGWHIAIAMPAYGILCIAFAQAILLFIQEKQLHPPPPFFVQLNFLPAIETMESTLFWLTINGFILLTLNLFLGMLSSWHHYGKILVFNHHIILCMAAWVCFGFLLLGRQLLGWRGENAAKWTMVSFIILVLGHWATSGPVLYETLF